MRWLRHRHGDAASHAVTSPTVRPGGRYSGTCAQVKKNAKGDVWVGETEEGGEGRGCVVTSVRLKNATSSVG